MAPESVFLSSGSPTRRVARRRFSRSTTVSAIDSCTSRRETCAATSPWLKKMPLTMPSIASSERGVLEDDVGRLATELQCQVLARAGERAAGDPCRPRSSCECHLVDPRVGDEAAPASDPAPVMTLTTPGGRSACWMIRRAKGRSTVCRRGLEHAGVAGCERRGKLPCRHHQREVPGDDLAGHPDGGGIRPEPA